MRNGLIKRERAKANEKTGAYRAFTRVQLRAIWIDWVYPDARVASLSLPFWRRLFPLRVGHCIVYIYARLLIECR